MGWIDRTNSTCWFAALSLFKAPLAGTAMSQENLENSMADAKFRCTFGQYKFL